MKKIFLIIIFFLSLVTAVAAADFDVNVEVESTTTPTTTTSPTATPTVTPTAVPLPAPTITYVDVIVSNTLRNLTIIGSNYQEGATVRINSQTYTPVYLDSSHLRLSLSSLASGTVNVRVTNPDGQYADYSFNYVNPTPTPTSTPTATVTPTITPTITATPVIILPQILQIDFRPNLDDEMEIMLIGNGFQDGAEVTINGIKQTVAYIDAEHLLITNLQDNLSGSLLFIVTNPDGGSDEMTYELEEPLVTPTVTPNVEKTLIEIFTINKENETLLVTGKNFVQGVKAYINGTEYSLEFIDSNHVRILGIKDLTGTLKIKLINPNGDTAEKTFMISAEVALESIPIVAVLKQVAEEAQVENIVVSGVATAVAVSSLADYLKLAFIPWKKRKKYWGLVLDSSTFTAIPLAIINAVNLNTKKIVATAVSDMEGRYGLILDSGEYHLEVKHYEYTLVMQSQPGVYYGQNLAISKETQLDLNILMSKTSHASEPLLNKIKKVWNFLMVKFTKIYPYILAIFLALNIYFLVITGQQIYYILVAYHIVLVLIFFLVIGKYKHQWATCVDSLNGNYVPRALIKLYQIDNNELIDTKVADAKGRFSFIIPKGSYQLVASAMGYSFPSSKNKAGQDQQNRFIIEYDNALSIDQIPFDSIEGAELLSANKFGVI